MSAHSSFRSWETRGVRRGAALAVVAGEGLPVRPEVFELLIPVARGLKLPEE